MMGKKFALLLCAVVVFMLCSCTTTFDSALLQPSRNEVSPKLPRLEIANNDKLAVSSTTNSVSTNSYLYTIFEREVETNICDDYGEKMGRIELVLIDNRFEVSASGYGWMALSIATGMIPNMLGMPLGANKYTLEFEVRIYANNGERVWRSSYIASENQNVTLFNYANKVDVKQIELFRELIDQCKLDITKDSSIIRERLESNR